MEGRGLTTATMKHNSLRDCCSLPISLFSLLDPTTEHSHSRGRPSTKALVVVKKKP